MVCNVSFPKPMLSQEAAALAQTTLSEGLQYKARTHGQFSRRIFSNVPSLVISTVTDGTLQVVEAWVSDHAPSCGDGPSHEVASERR